ncbi:MAG: NAD(P)-binding protein [Candidatus Devosia symbiotica]|nr:NAD(P)-binding protein [Candidatus Devosia symbiotica]
MTAPNIAVIGSEIAGFSAAWLLSWTQNVTVLERNDRLDGHANFRFTNNHAVLHSDASFMPRHRHLWSSWNYLRGRQGEDGLSLTYWMNSLQSLATISNLFVTLNPHRAFAPDTVQYRIDYIHPLFDAAAIAAQKDLWQVQGTQHSWFAGAWMGYSLHDDGLQAGLEVAECIGSAQRPWQVGGQRGRIAHNWLEGDLHLWAAQ